MTAARYARVGGVGSALPARVVPNSYFEAFVETSDEWIRERTGIRQRHFAGEGETTSTLSVAAATSALERAGVGPGSVDMLIVATCTPDRPLPATAAFVQAAMGMTCPAFDLNAACAGFVYGLSVADAQIRSGAADRVLVVGAEVLSRVLNMQDRTTCVLFGDGAGAAVLEASDEPGVIDSLLSMDGSQREVLTIRAGGSEEPLTEQAVAAGRQKIHMSDGQTVFRRAVIGMVEACASLLDKAGLAPDDISMVVAHQANARIISAVGARLGIEKDRLFLDIETVGNTSAASIPIAMDTAWRQGLLKPGDVVLTVAFGAGFAYGSNLVRWTAQPPARARADG